FAKRLKSLVAQIEDLSSKEVVNRLAKYLVKEIKKGKTENLPEPFIKLTIPKSTIAAYLGTITETLSRAFKKLHDDEIIRVNGEKIFITNLSKLKKLAED
ncbi:MAG: winged helix-turn-helix domain-containing protein, partial [Ignavibacteria bacterium]|nr:winged helix-turn-helix domain-containing protein [Ignavibacteria bacterium]